ncbi:MAG: hypothetical protein DRQ02_08010 [Candidatus Latescibacterota bacterium]|nr:MAG: hypothetical protein DRQ02_08010 [Candidatus Latescibacterota bacterium]
MANHWYALTFHLSLRQNQIWREGDFELEFIPKRVQTPFEGFRREFEVPGWCGIYGLTVPKRMIEVGKKVRISVSLLPPVADCITWFMVFDRKDTLKLTEGSLSEEIMVMQRDNIRFVAMIDALARKLYPELFPEKIGSENVVILHRGYSPEMGWVGVSDVGKLQNGEILASIRSASEHLSNDGKIYTICSKDGGKTWRDYQLVVSDKGVDHRDPSILQLEDGRFILHWSPDLAQNI